MAIILGTDFHRAGQHKTDPTGTHERILQNALAGVKAQSHIEHQGAGEAVILPVRRCHGVFDDGTKVNLDTYGVFYVATDTADMLCKAGDLKEEDRFARIGDALQNASLRNHQILDMCRQTLRNKSTENPPCTIAGWDVTETGDAYKSVLSHMNRARPQTRGPSLS